MNVLLYLVHPRLDRSEISGPMFRAALDHDHVTGVDLYAEYPTFEIDVRKEQQRLVAHDAVLFLHPLYWYSTPSLIKEWLDLVLEHGFAYGTGGTALEGKIGFNAISCGADQHAYTKGGALGVTLQDLMLPMKKTFDLCGMTYLPPFAMYSSARAHEEKRADLHLSNWNHLLQDLRNNTFPVVEAQTLSTLNTLPALAKHQPNHQALNSDSEPL